ncbi:acetyl-CoA acetyltransferase [Desulfosarcina widdelii]|uniref:Acetyl-CoA acetyltransferase n=1 Tax=Desulfosarcina widdelii TaxID=947919 RepID=A0A5K7YWV2_9BACT|nr:thiolase family protein [Desulfosarcina widdelii]BBO73098.1 acetyl-CoA acetyltransferase [Desulfosarcina widdelii]
MGEGKEMIQKKAVIVSAVRTPICDFGGGFKNLKAGDLSAIVMREAISRAGIKPSMIDEIIWGCCLQDFDEPNVARCSALKANIPIEVPAFTVQRQCSSGMQAIQNAAQLIRYSEAEIVLCGGVESYSTAPYVFRKGRWGARLMHQTMEDSIWNLLYSGGEIIMGQTAELIAKKYYITREEADEVALRSHNNAENAIITGKFKDEIVPVEIQSGKGKTKVIEQDEHVRFSMTLEDLNKLKPVFEKGGIVTAGNSSGINDGAAALLVTSEDKANKLGLTILGTIGDFAVAGVEPNYMGEGPIPAVRKLLQKSKVSLNDIKLIELNEAFATQYIACEKELGLNRNICNVNGSGVALGHPVGCTGARIVISLIYEMKRREVDLGLATLCAGGGMGTAIFVRRD